jgi:hypothetical protein
LTTSKRRPWNPLDGADDGHPASLKAIPLLSLDVATCDFFHLADEHPKLGYREFCSRWDSQAVVPEDHELVPGPGKRTLEAN